MRSILNIVKLVIFDLNGTLQDDLWLAYLAVVRIFEYFGIKPPTLGEYRKWISTNFRTFFTKFGIPESAPKELLTSIRQKVFEEYQSSKILRPDTYAVMDWLKSQGVGLSIVSGEDEVIFEKRMVQFEFSDGYIYPQFGGVPRKDEALRKVVYTLKLESCPSKIFYVDDSKDGIEAAKRCGIRTFGMKDGYAFPWVIEAANPDYAIMELSEIIDIFKGIVNR